MFEISLIFIFSNFQNDKALGDPPLTRKRDPEMRLPFRDCGTRWLHLWNQRYWYALPISTSLGLGVFAYFQQRKLDVDDRWICKMR